MKRLILLTILANFSVTSNAQNFSAKTDSSTRTTAKKLPEDNKKQFEIILNNRPSVGFPQRIDTTQADYIFIEETFCITDEQANVTERYFFDSDRKILTYAAAETQKSNAISRYLFFNSAKQDVDRWYYSDVVAGIVHSNIYEYYYTLDSLISLSSNLKPPQALTFDSTPVVSLTADSIINKRPELENARIEALKITCQVLTFIDKGNL